MNKAREETTELRTMLSVLLTTRAPEAVETGVGGGQTGGPSVVAELEGISLGAEPENGGRTGSIFTWRKKDGAP